MQEKSDAQLLRDYADHGHDAAFGEIVTRYTDLVYSAALRQVEATDLAADISQSVFVDLARKARSVAEALAESSSLAGWLYRGTRYEALNLRRGEQRRQSRERQAMERLLPTADTATDWEQLRPVLDEAMADLEETDREALLMRYFQNYDLRTVGAALGVSDDAAQKRVSRALEKLRESFLRRELTTATGTLAVIISTNAVLAAPAGLATSISTAAALAGMSVIPAAVIATKTIAMTTLQKALVGTTVAVLAGAGIYEARQAAQLGERVRTLQQQQAPLAARIREMEGASDEAGRQLAALREENERLKSLSAERLKLSGEVAKLRNQASEAAQEIRTLRQAPEAKSPAEEAPAHFAKESWAFAGYATPEAALQSVAWAQSKGSLETFLAGLGTEARAEVLSALKRKPELEASLFSEINKVKSFTILKKVPLAEDQMLFRVRNELEDGTAKVTVTTLKRTEGEWKVQSGRAE